MFLLKQTTHRMTVQHHPLIGHLFVPNIDARLPNENGGYFVKTNSEGFRSEWDFTKEKGDKKRILFFGDSFIVGDHCDNRERFSELCGEALNAETYNYGLPGSGTDQQMLIYEEFAKNVEADVIVIGVMVENIDRITLASRPSIDRTTGKEVKVPKPYFTLENGQLVHHHNPVPKEREIIEARQTEDSLISKTVREANKLTKKYTGSNHSKLRSSLVKLSGYTPQPQYKDANHPDLALMEAILNRFIEQASKQAKVVVVPIPTPHYLIDGVKAHYRPFFERFHKPENNVHLYDITPELLELPWETRERMNFDVDNHFSPLGHKIMAEHISGYIAKTFSNDFSSPKQVSEPGRKRAQAGDEYILGVSCFYHNSGACILKNGEIMAAAEEERFTRLKNDKGFPNQAANFCMEHVGIHQEDLKAVVYYDNYDLTFERLIASQIQLGQDSAKVWDKVGPSWLSYKLHIPEVIKQNLKFDGLVLKNQHHRSHAASAYYPSPFDSAAILTIDGVGEWATATIGVAKGGKMEVVKEMHFPHSLGLLYSAFTQFTGFKVNSGEYKMMGLAPYGEPTYVDLILENIVTLHDDGSVELNMEYFDFLSAHSMCNSKWDELFGGPAMELNGRLTKREFDIAKSAQVVTEMAIIKMAEYAHKITGEKNLCMAGGVALNCVANGKILESTPFEDLWIQPAAGDSGCALGAALDAHYNYFGRERLLGELPAQKGSYWGPGFENQEVEAFLKTFGYPYEKLDNEALYSRIAEELMDGKVVGHMGGRCEFGPRALGNRSILGDSRNTKMQSTLNLKIKFRESFRPFAPSVLEEDSPKYFEMEGESPYMLLVAPVNKDRCIDNGKTETEDLLAIVNEPRSDVPAITHVDYSARIQTVKKSFNKRYHDLISAFKAKTDYGLVVNTSFNVRGEPIVLSPYDSYRCFMRTNMDVLVMENFILYKPNQPEWPEDMGVGLEDEEKKVEAEDEKFMKDLHKMFESDITALIKRFENVDLLNMSKDTSRDSIWTDALNSNMKKEDFEIPADMQTIEDNGTFVAALTSKWKNQELAKAFQEQVKSLEKVSKKHKKNFSVQEEVEDSVYVMF